MLAQNLLAANSFGQSGDCSIGVVSGAQSLVSSLLGAVGSSHRSISSFLSRISLGFYCVNASIAGATSGKQQSNGQTGNTGFSNQ